MTGPSSTGAAVDESANDPCLVRWWLQEEDLNEALPRRPLVLIRIDFQVAILRVKGGVARITEVPEISALNTNVAIDDALDLPAGEGAGFSVGAGWQARHLVPEAGHIIDYAACTSPVISSAISSTVRSDVFRASLSASDGL